MESSSTESGSLKVLPPFPHKMPGALLPACVMETVRFWNQSIISALMSWCLFLLGKLQLALNSTLFFLDRDLTHLEPKSLDGAVLGFVVQGSVWTCRGAGEEE